MSMNQLYRLFSMFITVSLASLMVPDACLYSQDFGGMGYVGYRESSAEVGPSSNQAPLAEIELKLESVLELLPLALPNQDLQTERQVLVQFFDHLISKTKGDQSHFAQSSGEEELKNENQVVERLTLKLKRLEQIHALKQKTIQSRIELLKLRAEHHQEKKKTAERSASFSN